MITAVVTSDNHLGAYWGRLRPDHLETRRRQLQQNFERVVDAAIEIEADLFLQAGDLFDRPDPRNAERLFVARQFARLRQAGIPIYAVAGNHDSPHSLGYDGGVLPHQEAAILGAIHLFRETHELHHSNIEVKGVRVSIVGVSSNFNLPDGECPLAGYSAPPKQGDIEIALLHYGVEGWAPPFGREPVLSLSNLNKLKADAICVGHLHARNQRRLPGGALLLNPGATEHINFGEEKLECGFWILRFDGKTTESEYRALPTQPMSTYRLLLMEEDESKEELTEWAQQEIEVVSNADQLLRVQLEGEISREKFQTLDLGRLQEVGNSRNFLFRLDADKLIVRDQWGELPIGFGVSFDAHEELQNTARAMEAVTTEDDTQTQITRLAAREIEARFELWMGGANTLIATDDEAQAAANALAEDAA